MESSRPGLVLKPSRHPRSLTSQSSGFLGNYRLFPDTPVGMRSGETALLCSSTGTQTLRPRFAKFFPLPHAAWVWRRGPAWRDTHFDGRGGGDARFQRLAPGRVEAAAPAARPSKRGSQLKAPRAGTPVHPPSPHRTPKPLRGQGHGKEQPSSYCRATDSP